MVPSPDKLRAEWFWVDRWTTSSGALLPMAARGLYREMLSQAWIRGAKLPDDAQQIRRATHCTVEEWNEYWPQIERYWDREDGCLVNRTQQAIFSECMDQFTKAQDRGRNAALHRWHPENGDPPTPTKPTEPKAKAAPKPGQTDAEWLDGLATTFDHVDIQFEYKKMVAWCELHDKKPTRKRFLAWLSRIDRPLPGAEPELTMWDTAPRVWACEGNPNCPEKGYHLAKNPKSVPVSKRCPLLPASEEVRP